MQSNAIAIALLPLVLLCSHSDVDAFIRIKVDNLLPWNWGKTTTEAQPTSLPPDVSDLVTPSSETLLPPSTVDATPSSDAESPTTPSSDAESPTRPSESKRLIDAPPRVSDCGPGKRSDHRGNCRAASK